MATWTKETKRRQAVEDLYSQYLRELSIRDIFDTMNEHMTRNEINELINLIQVGDTCGVGSLVVASVKERLMMKAENNVE